MTSHLATDKFLLAYSVIQVLVIVQIVYHKQIPPFAHQS